MIDRKRMSTKEYFDLRERLANSMIYKSISDVKLLLDNLIKTYKKTNFTQEEYNEELCRLSYRMGINLKTLSDHKTTYEEFRKAIKGKIK